MPSAKADTTPAIIEIAQTEGPTFAELGLATPLLQAVQELGYASPTPVQQQAIPAAIAGGDWMVSSQTGSGKTAAFLLPILNRLLASKPLPQQKTAQPQALVLCPTRELAQQVAADAVNFLRGMGPAARGQRVGTVVGGVPFGKQLMDLRNATLVVATPGRLLDLNEHRQIRLDQVAVMVLDEADRMLDLGFAEDVEAIHQVCSKRDQTLMFSATFAPRIMQLAENVMNQPGRLALASAHDRHSNIEQSLYWADNFTHKKKILDHWLRDVNLDQAVVFASTQADTELIAEELMQSGHSAVALHGAMPQSVRNRRLQNLRDGRIRILVATDVAARGIDVPTISHVINFGLPMKAEDYVHRIGRTGRAGRSGTAVTIAEYRERSKIRQIEQYTRQPMSASVIEGLEPSPPKPSSRPAGKGGRFKSGGGYRSDSNAPRGHARGGQEFGSAVPGFGAARAPHANAGSGHPGGPRGGSGHRSDRPSSGGGRRDGGGGAPRRSGGERSYRT